MYTSGFSIVYSENKGGYTRVFVCAEVLQPSQPISERVQFA